MHKILRLLFITTLLSFFSNITLFSAGHESYIIRFKDVPSNNILDKIAARHSIAFERPFKQLNQLIDSKSNQTLSTEQINRIKSFYSYIVVSNINSKSLAAIQSDPELKNKLIGIEPNYIFKIEEDSSPKSDPKLSQQWGLKKVNASKAWGKATGKGIKVAVIDTGIDFEHPDLVNSLMINSAEDINNDGIFNESDLNGIDDDNNGFIDDVIGYDFVDQSVVNVGDDDVRDPIPADEHSHGTIVSGIIAAEGDNGIGIKGVAYNSKILALRAFDVTGNGESDDIAAAVMYAVVRGADVINMSFGEEHASSVVEDALKFAYSSGVVLVASSGNNGWNYPHFPSDYKEVISVGAVQKNGLRSSISNYGTNLDLVAPGIDILSTTLNNSYVEKSGTSFSAPHVSAAAAILKELHPDDNCDDIRGYMKTSADDYADIGWDVFYGSGILNIGNAVEMNGKSDISFSYPTNNQYIDKNKTPILKIKGSIATPMFAAWEIHLGRGTDPTTWERLGSINDFQQINAELVSVNFDERPDLNDTAYTLKLYVILKNNNTIEHRINFSLTSSESPLTFKTLKTIPVWHNNIKTVFISAETKHKSKFFVKFRKKNSEEEYTQITDQNRNAQTHAIVLDDFVEPGKEYEAIATAIRNDGSIAEEKIDFTVEEDVFPESGFVIKPYDLPQSYLNNNAGDLYGNGKAAIALNDISTGTWGNTKIYEFDNNAFVEKESKNEVVLPKDIGDSNNDGIMEVMTTVFLKSKLYQAKTKGNDILSSVIWSDELSGHGWAADFHDFTGDGVDDIITYGDSAFYLRSYENGEYVLKATATDMTQGRFNRLGLIPGYAFGDFDNDGNQELCHSNRYGNMRIYEYKNGKFSLEKYDTLSRSGSEQYYCSADIDGDGTPEIIAGSFGSQISFDSYENGEPLWSFRIWKANAANSYSIIWEDHFYGVRGSSTYKNGITSGNIDAVPGDELVISIFPNLYVLKWDKTKSDMTPLWRYPATYSNSAIIYDFDQNGVNEIGFTTFSNTAFFEYDNSDRPAPPADLKGYAVDGTSVKLSWRASANAETYEALLMTKTENGYSGKPVGITDNTEIIVNNLSDETNYEFVVRSVNNSMSKKFSDISNFADIFTHNPIFVSDLTLSGTDKIIVEYDKAYLPDRNIDRGSFELLNADDEFSATPNTAQKISNDKILLSFNENLESGNMKLKCGSFPDYFNTPVISNIVDIVIPEIPEESQECYLLNLNVLSSTELVLTYSSDIVKNDAENITNYMLKPLGQISKIEQSASDKKIVNIYLNPKRPLSAIGKNYTLTVSNVKTQSGSDITDGPGNTLGFVFTASAPDNPFVYPNPVKISQDDEIFFANIPARAKIHVLSLKGELLQTIDELDGNGGAEWNGRDRNGEKLKHGIYLYKVIQINSDGSTDESSLNKFTVLP